MQCVLLNADYSYLNIVDWKRAVCLIVKNKVQVLSYSESVVRSAEGLVMKVPAVIKLIKNASIKSKSRMMESYLEKLFDVPFMRSASLRKRRKLTGI